ncbi:MAG: LysE family transporter, partial [Coriobacteriia bacterium]|nr:LysE family transporter [Coriobacteriia bacterium]
MTAGLAGFGIGAGLIIAIGAQNAFVLRQGLKREHVALVVAVCVVCDWVLIAAGALGFGSLVRAFPLVTAIAAWGGALFLAGYGVMSLRAALRPTVLSAADDAPDAPATVSAVLVATLAVSLLNPHVYLDTVVLLGSVAAQYAGAER